jgi:MFS family permease
VSALKNIFLIFNFDSTGVQGIGGGGIIALSEILVSDLISLAERGTYKGLIGLGISLCK